MARLVRAATDRNPPPKVGGGCQKISKEYKEMIHESRSNYNKYST